MRNSPLRAFMERPLSMMLQHGPSLGTAAVLFTLAGVLVLHFLSGVESVQRIDWRDAGSYCGSLVSVEGIVAHATMLRSGAIFLELNQHSAGDDVLASGMGASHGAASELSSNEYGGNLSEPPQPVRIPVMVESTVVPLSVGDFVRVRGVVEPYGRGYQLKVSDSHGLHVLSRWDQHYITLAHLAFHPAAYVDAQVWIVGFLEDLWNGSGEGGPFYLGTISDAPVDARYHLRFRVCSIFIPALSEGDAVYVQGVFRYDSERFTYEVVLSSKAHIVGRRAL